MTNKQKQQRLAEYRTIAKIGQRAVKLLGNSHDYTTIIMDIECVHKKMPLGLARLLAADNFNFAHDIIGINRYLNRRTEELEGSFLPRFTA